MLIRINYMCDKIVYMKTFVVHEFLKEWENDNNIVKYFHNRLQAKKDKEISLKQLFVCNDEDEILYYLNLNKK